MKPLEIWQPRYSTNDCLILASKVKSDDQIYRIYFTKAPHLNGNRYHMKGHEIKSLGKLEKLKSGKTVYAVPMDVLEKFKEVI